MNKPNLNDSTRYPDDAVLAEYLGKTKSVWDEFQKLVAIKFPSLSFSWNFYKDGNAWLCKLVDRKKTICWISIWDNFFKVTFYFNEKNSEDIKKLKIDETLKEIYFNAKNIGKLKPLTMEVSNKKILKDIAELINYKNL
jgi:hypothetical protein